MRRIFLALVFLLPASVHAGIDNCSSLIGSCDYYECIDAQRISCGDQGYPLGYGKRYCEKFSALEFSEEHSALSLQVFPGDPTEWRDNVRSCLQTEMETFFESEAEPTCDSLREFAFNSHPGCYTEGPSFCDLNPEAVVRVGLTISGRDLITSESQRQIRDTAELCDQHISNKLASERRFMVRVQLQHYRAVWKILAANPFGIGGMLSSHGSAGSGPEENVPSFED